MSGRKWVPSPKVTADLDGKVTGRVVLKFFPGGRVNVQTHAHVNDEKTAVTYRDQDFLVNVHMCRQDDGTFAPTSDVHVAYREMSRYTRQAPRTFKAAIVAALASAVAAHWSPELQAEADRAYAVQSLGTLERDLAEAEAKVAELRAEILPHRRILGEI